MRLLFIGDVVGRAGRQALARHLPALRARLKLDFVIANAENAAHGFGITAKVAAELYDAGADALTLGNHAWDQREALTYIETDPKLLRPANFPPGTPGKGQGLYERPDGRRILVVNVLGRVFMEPLDDPFAAVAAALGACPLGEGADAIVIDIHAEATSEKMAMGHFADGRASLVVGSHSHVPTADAQILPQGTAYQTDAGACADYDSVIGMDKDEPLNRFLRKIPQGRFTPAEGEGTLCAVFVATSDKTGLAERIEPVRLGGRLKETCPEL
jgi:2',3'-cyclic-nucleotide 2'-phosphodiesterase